VPSAGSVRAVVAEREQAEVLAQGGSGVVGAVHAFVLQDRDDGVDELVEAAGVMCGTRM
jgi:stage V sporulation protein SpoVS